MPGQSANHLLFILTIFVATLAGQVHSNRQLGQAGEQTGRGDGVACTRRAQQKKRERQTGDR